MGDHVFITALDAVHFLSPHVGGDQAAKLAIIERLKDGAIRARGWWLAEGVDLGAPYLKPKLSVIHEGDYPGLSAEAWEKFRKENFRPVASKTKIGDGYAMQVISLPSGSKKDLIIAQSFWVRMTPADLADCEWSTGFFIARMPAEKTLINGTEQILSRPTRLFTLGVEFERNDITRMIDFKEKPSGPSKLETPSKSSNAGRKRSDKWAPWTAAVVMYILENGEENLTANKLVEEIEKRLAGKFPYTMSKSTVACAADAIVKALADARAKAISG